MMNKRFFTELFCIHIWKVTKRERLDPDNRSYWVDVAKHQKCLKCDKERIKVVSAHF